MVVTWAWGFAIDVCPRDAGPGAEVLCITLFP